MSVATMLSRVTGFVRIWAQAFALGATLLTSSYVVANNIPNMVYELVAGGVLSSIFIPIFMERRAKFGEDDARDFASSAFFITMIALGIVSLIGTIWPEPFVLTQIPAGNTQNLASAVYMFRFFAIQILIYGVGALLTGILNSHRVFLAPAAGPVLNNLVVIATLFAFVPIAATGNFVLAVTVLAAGTTLGVVAQMAIQVPSLIKTGFRLKWRIDLKNEGLRRLLLLAGPTLIYVITNLIGVTFRNRFAFSAAVPGLPSGTGPGILTYAWVWYQLPHGIFAVALGTALLPELSSAAHNLDWGRFSRNFGLGLRATALLILPSAALLVAMSPQVVGLFVGGAFKQIDVAPTAQVLSVWALGLFSFSAYMLVLKSFFAVQDTRTPAATNVLATTVQVLLYWALTGGVATWVGLGLAGIPAADAIAYTVHVLLLGYLLRRKVGPLEFGRSVSSIGRTLVVAVAAGLVAWGIVLLTPWLGASRLTLLLQLVVGASAAVLVAWALATVLRISEIATVTRLVKRVLGRLVPGRA